MGRFVRKTDGSGQLAGSIGDGRDTLPTPALTTVTPPVAGTRAAGGSLTAARNVLVSDDGAAVLAKMNALPDVHVRPLEPYPGRIHVPWRLACVLCEQKGCDCNTRQVLAPLPNNIIIGQRMPCCCYTGKRLTHDDAAAMLDLHMPGWTPYNAFPGSLTKPWMVHCPDCGAQNTTTLQAVRSVGKKPICFWCSPAEVSQQFLELVDANYDVVIPQAIVSAPHEPWPATCRTCGDDLVLRYDQVTAGMPQQCACNPRTGLTDEQARAIVVNKFPDTTFDEPYPGDTDLRWNMHCTVCGKAAAPTLTGVRAPHYKTIGCGCKEAGRNRHDETRLAADLQAKHADVDIISVTSTGKEAVVRMRCPQGHDTRDLVVNVKQVKQACRDCRSGGGYDPTLTGYLYVLTGLVRGRPALKFGITNYPDDRLATHARTGLDTVVMLHEYPDGQTAADIERACKQLRTTHSIPSAKDEGTFFDGYTETVYLDSEDAAVFATAVQALVTERTEQAMLHELLAS